MAMVGKVVFSDVITMFIEFPHGDAMLSQGNHLPTMIADIEAEGWVLEVMQGAPNLASFTMERAKLPVIQLWELPLIEHVVSYQ